MCLPRLHFWCQLRARLVARCSLSQENSIVYESFLNNTKAFFIQKNALVNTKALPLYRINCIDYPLVKIRFRWIKVRHRIQQLSEGDHLIWNRFSNMSDHRKKFGVHEGFLLYFTLYVNNLSVYFRGIFTLVWQVTEDAKRLTILVYSDDWELTSPLMDEYRKRPC